MINLRLRRNSSVSALLMAALLLATPFVQQATAQQEMKPVAVVALSGYDALIEDINFAGSLASQPQLGSMLEPMIMGYLQGLDKTKPIGVIIQSDGADFGGAACVPVTDLKQMLSPLQLFGVTTEDVGEGITKVVTPQEPVFVKEKAGWAFVSPKKEMLDQVPQNPEKLLAELNSEYDFGARFNVQNIPAPYREMAAGWLEEGMKSGMRKLPEESDEEHATRMEMVNLQMEQLKQLINEVDEVTIGLTLDSPQQRAYLDFIYTAVAGSKLSEQIALYADSKTDFAGFYQPDAAATMTFTSKMTEADIANVDQMFGALRNQVKVAIEKEAELPSEDAKDVVKSAMDDFLDAVQATLKTGMLDGGMVLNLAPSSLTFVAGGFIGEPDKIVSGLKKIEGAVAEEPDFPGIQWDADSHAGVKFHTMAVPVPDHEEEAKQLFGETLDVAVGIGTKSVYFALGSECVAAAKQVIDSSQASPQKEVPPMEFTMSLQQILEMASGFAEADQKPMLDMLASVLATEAAGRDHIRIVAKTVPNGILTRLEAEEGVLRVIGQAAMQAQAQAAGAGAGF